MSEEIIIPTADAVITPVLERMYEERPSTFRHLNLRSGRWWHPVLGFRAQTALMLKRLASLASARKLDTAEKQELLDYVASEYEAPPTDKTYAFGTLTLSRDPELTLPGGVIPAGTRFTRGRFEELGVLFPTAAFETLVDASVPVDSAADITIQVRAAEPGVAGNTPKCVGLSTTGVTFPNLVRNVTVSAFEAAGGSDGQSGSDFDTFVRLFARSHARGEYGPTSDASRLGALAATGVRHILTFDDVATGTERILIADSAWASSDRWAAAVQQAMYDLDYVGFGCLVNVGAIRNKVVTVETTVELRDANYLVETTEIDLAIQEAVRSYFDDRPDWNVWNADALKSTIARSHAKVFNCPTIAVKDFATGAAVSQILTPDYDAEQFHYLVASNATKISYTGPS